MAAILRREGGGIGLERRGMRRAREMIDGAVMLDRKEAAQEADDCWQEVYQWLLDVIVWPLPDTGGDPPQSK